MQYICKCKLIESIVTKYGKDNYCSILMLISLTSYAQGLMWTAKAELNMSSMSNVEESKMHPGFYAGIGAEYAIDENWSVRLSLLFTMKGVKQDYKF